MGDPVTRVSSQTGGLSQRQATTFYLVSAGRPQHARPQVCAGRPGGLGLGWCALRALFAIPAPRLLGCLRGQTQETPLQSCSPCAWWTRVWRGWGSSYILSYAHTLSLSSLQGVNDHLSTEKGQSLSGRRGLVSLPCLQGDQLHTYCVLAGLCSLWGSLPCTCHPGSLWGCKSCPCVLGAPA